MDPNALLAQLRDVTQPEAIGFWPIAPGWWLLGTLCLAIALGLIYCFLNYKRQRRWLKQARAELILLKKAYLNNPNPANLSDLNRLLKRSYASARQDRRVLNQTGSEWSQLMSTITNKDLPILQQEDIEILSVGLYQSEPKMLSADAFKRIEKWLSQLR